MKEENKKKIVGVFALQGAFIEHKNILERLGAEVLMIRDISDVQNKKIDAVILPGGESTTMTKLLKKTGLDKWLEEYVKSGAPIFGTCAGMILLSKMGLIDIEVDRNAYGSQLDSFETQLEFMEKKFKGVFIRAPKVKKMGSNVKVLVKHADVPVLVREKNVLVGSFHPELTEDGAVHDYFLKI